MKKAFFLKYTLILAVLTMIVVNVQITKSDSSSEMLELDDLISIAKADDPEMNPFGLWFSQGMYADEREEWTECSSSSGGGVSACLKYGPYGGCLEWSWENGSPTQRMDCLYGSTNCSSTSC